MCKPKINDILCKTIDEYCESEVQSGFPLKNINFLL